MQISLKTRKKPLSNDDKHKTKIVDLRWKSRETIVFKNNLPYESIYFSYETL